MSTTDASPVQLSGPLDSQIISELPTSVFSDFQGKWASLLWRGSRDGFAAADFHSRCNLHPNTLTLILDTDGNIFGGFTPLEWESELVSLYGGGISTSSEGRKADSSQRSFLFTLKNPHNIPARKFALLDSASAVYTGGLRGPGFGFNDLRVSGDCDEKDKSSTGSFGSAYRNDTGLDGSTVFTGSKTFRVKEIEVFGFTDADPLAPLEPVQPSRSLDSVILSELPEVLTEFQGKSFSLLWRGGRDGFRAKEFHRRCDGHANTLTVVLDTKGNIFGGFTPVQWELRKLEDFTDALMALKGDDSMKSFLFTLVNEHNVPPMKFPVKEKNKHQAIMCNGGGGPCFGGSDLMISDGCNVGCKNGSFIGIAYANDTGVSGLYLLAGSKNFNVKEIEVFEITD